MVSQPIDPSRSRDAGAPDFRNAHPSVRGRTCGGRPTKLTTTELATTELATTKLATLSLVVVVLGGCALSHGRADEGADGGRADVHVTPDAPLEAHRRVGSYHEAAALVHRVGSLPRLRACLPRGGTVERCVLTQREPGEGCSGRGRRRTPAGCVIERDETEAGGYWREEISTSYCREGSLELVVDMEGVPERVHVSIACALDTYLPGLTVRGWRAGEAPAAVGRSCTLPEVPTGGLTTMETLVAVDPDACGGLPCVASGLEGDPRVICGRAEDGEDCTPAHEVAAHIACSCRCSRLEGDPSVPLCACPDGTVCSDELLRVPGTGVGGGWCVPCSDDPFTPNVPRCRG